jgi:hypothetical protein
MAIFAMWRAAATLLIAAMLVGMSAKGALAQEYAGSTVTSGDTTTDVGGDVLALAPGVTISEGDVSNQTGIGVAITGGISAGAAPGGGSDASVVE